MRWLWTNCRESFDNSQQHRTSNGTESLHWESRIRHYFHHGEEANGIQGQTDFPVRFCPVLPCGNEAECQRLQMAWQNAHHIRGTQDDCFWQKNSVWGSSESMGELFFYKEIFMLLNFYKITRFLMNFSHFGIKFHSSIGAVYCRCFPLDAFMHILS